MPQYESIDASEGIDVNKTNLSKECMLCHYWFFKDFEFKFEEHVCSGCHDFINNGLFVRKYSDIKRKRSYFKVDFVGY